MSDEQEILAKEAAGAVPLRNTQTPYAMTMETVNGFLKRYVEVMAPNASVTEEAGLECQKGLLRHIRMILRLEGHDFDQAWSELLQWVYANLKGCMGPRYNTRFLDKAITIARIDRDFLERLIHLLCATADGQTRGPVISRYDWKRIQRVVNDVTIAEKIQGYYQQFV